MGFGSSLTYKHNNIRLTVINLKLSKGIAGNGQVLLQVWNSLLVLPGYEAQ